MEKGCTGGKEIPRKPKDVKYIVKTAVLTVVFGLAGLAGLCRGGICHIYGFASLVYSCASFVAALTGLTA